jgi:hypothetical protein
VAIGVGIGLRVWLEPFVIVVIVRWVIAGIIMRG